MKTMRQMERRYENYKKNGTTLQKLRERWNDATKTTRRNDAMKTTRKLGRRYENYEQSSSSSILASCYTILSPDIRMYTNTVFRAALHAVPGSTASISCPFTTRFGLARSTHVTRAATARTRAYTGKHINKQVRNINRAATTHDPLISNFLNI
jgi:hypothetical protein